MQRIILPALSALLIAVISCDHFIGDLFPAKDRVEVSDIVGRWQTQKKGETNLLRIERWRGSRTDYLIAPEGEDDRAIARFARIGGELVGEYRSISSNNAVSPNGFIILVRITNDRLSVILANDITAKTAREYRLRVDAPYDPKRDTASVRLAGTPDENKRAVETLMKAKLLFDRSAKKEPMDLIRKK